ncbi:brassinosteroid-responsive RING protein 1-like [Nicotiana tabacum]|uniref:Brassinosteroid-responsive RING protein 1-like n=2 Tax=Nicotiana TaxID=4085 RepID=A0A1S4B1L8_TOBAC|nr:PREDICTED: E3 ubiquitin-protein ligase RHA1B-like [Nicotiana sylvestris]XP_016482744.1 PREDICTED: E3 ubiquitin-protein ligase RHA1B-like [Nicotiana tabacum]
MGFPLGYTELYLPKLLLHVIIILGFIKELICTLFKLLGLEDFLEPEFSYPTRPESCSEPRFHSLSAALIREILPVVKYSEIMDPPENCAVCLYEFELDDEIRRLRNCQHVFHRSCVDRWMDHDQMTCPLCRAVFVPDDMMEDFNEKLWLASGVSDFYDEYSSIAAGL